MNPFTKEELALIRDMAQHGVDEDLKHIATVEPESKAAYDLLEDIERLQSIRHKADIMLNQ